VAVIRQTLEASADAVADPMTTLPGPWPALPGRNVGDIADHLPTGASAVKSRPSRSGISYGTSPATVRLCRHGRGWQGSRPSSRINARTSSSPQATPEPARSACTRRYPWVPSEASNDRPSCFSSSRRRGVAESGRSRHS
jgi:hypothetical protein